MPLIRNLVACITCILWLNSCGDATIEQVPVDESADTLLVVDTLIAGDTATFGSAVRARLQAGDTVAVDHKRLDAVLTHAIPGYQLELNKSASFETNEFAFSEAMRLFYDEAGGYIELTLGDYVANPEFIGEMLARYRAIGEASADSEMREVRVAPEIVPADGGDFFTWSSYNEELRIARVYMGLDYRYFATIEARGHRGFLDLQKVKDWLDWDALNRAAPSPD